MNRKSIVKVKNETLDTYDHNIFFDIWSNSLELIHTYLQTDNTLQHLKHKQNFDIYTRLSKAVFTPYSMQHLPMLSATFANSMLDICKNLARNIHTLNEPADSKTVYYLGFATTWYNMQQQFYIALKNYYLQWYDSIENLDDDTKIYLAFHTKLYADLFSPLNLLNPKIIESNIKSNGYSAIQGINNFVKDLIDNKGRPNIRMTDLNAFKLGDNIACTPGKVVFQNELMQLIRYQPTTDKVYKTPILITPPWINKYYVLDLSKQNSLVKWLVDQGFTVFMISWINPDASHANYDFEDYMQLGPLQAVDCIQQMLDCNSIHMVGYCIGGTLLSCALSYMQQKNDKRAKSATFLMSLLDFSEPGEIGVFLDNDHIKSLESQMKDEGYLNGHMLDMTFNMLRPNELIWPYLTDHYLLGKPKRPFDILYWNADSSNLPYKMYSFYLRNMYLENKLREPGGISLNGVPIDLKKITTPAFFLGAEVDHITMWPAIFNGIQLLSGPVNFVVTESGHVRGVLNPPGPTKYGFITNEQYNKSATMPDTIAQWLKGTDRHEGSWWPYWFKWLQKQDSEQIAATPIPTNLVIEDAPGSYVLKRI